MGMTRREPRETMRGERRAVAEKMERKRRESREELRTRREVCAGLGQTKGSHPML